MNFVNNFLHQQKVETKPLKLQMRKDKLGSNKGLQLSIFSFSCTFFINVFFNLWLGLDETGYLVVCYKIFVVVIAFKLYYSYKSSKSIFQLLFVLKSLFTPPPLVFAQLLNLSLLTVFLVASNYFLVQWLKPLPSHSLQIPDFLNLGRQFPPLWCMLN